VDKDPTRWYRRVPELSIGIAIIFTTLVSYGFLVQRGLEPAWVRSGLQTVGLGNLLYTAPREELVSTLSHNLQMRQYKAEARGFRYLKGLDAGKESREAEEQDRFPLGYRSTFEHDPPCPVRGCSRRLGDEISEWDREAENLAYRRGFDIGYASGEPSEIGKFYERLRTGEWDE